MPQDRRNVIVVVSLIAAMTAGAQLLRWFEPSTPQWTSATELSAETGAPIEDVTIEFAADDTTLAPEQVDCVVYPDRSYTWSPRGSHLRLVVRGTADGSLPREQGETLLAILGGLCRDQNLPLDRIRLAPDSDVRSFPDLPRQAHDLRALLDRKGLAN